MLHCLFCNSVHVKPCSFQDAALFNNNTWRYVRCMECRLVMLYPLPGKEELDMMYDSDYHTAYYFKGETYSVIGYEKILNDPQVRKILDFGCGDGAFLRALEAYPFKKDGVEYTVGLVEELKRQVPGVSFFTIDQFLKDINDTYDLIHLGDVLEHSNDPKGLLHMLTGKLNANGYLLIDGPLEANRNLAYFSRRAAQAVKRFFNKDPRHVYTPYHLIFANARNQLELFERAGYHTIKYKVYETAWPYPEQLPASLSGALQFLVARISIILSGIMPGWGNRFRYIGRKSKVPSLS
jgi:SAM-dependent methyltransferase